MLLRQMKSFVAVINGNSFTEAAEQCYILSPLFLSRSSRWSGNRVYSLFLGCQLTFSMAACGNTTESSEPQNGQS